MKIFVKAKPSTKKEAVEKISENTFLVSVKERPEGGKANAAILHALADYFGVAYFRLKIISGHTAKNKIVEIVC